MRHCLVQTMLLCVGMLSAAPAAEQERFDEVVAATRFADELAEEGKSRQAMAQYQLARKQLIEFQETFPRWNSALVARQLSYLSSQLELVELAVAGEGDHGVSNDVTVPSSEEQVRHLERANQQYQVQLLQLHEENARLNAKLREALALRPAVEEPARIAENQARLERTESELTLARAKIAELRAELESYPEPEEALRNVGLLEETRKNLNTVLGEAEELRRLNAELRRAAARPGISNNSADETARRAAGAAQLAQRMAEEDAAELRVENERLHQRLLALEARFSTENLTSSPPSRPSLRAADAARLALANGDSTEAINILTKGLQGNADDVELLSLMARAYQTTGQTVEAELRLKRILEVTPESGVAHFELARLYSERDRESPGLARWHYHKALNLGFPRNAALELQIGWEQPGD